MSIQYFQLYLLVRQGHSCVHNCSQFFTLDKLNFTLPVLKILYFQTKTEKLI